MKKISDFKEDAEEELESAEQDAFARKRVIRNDHQKRKCDDKADNINRHSVLKMKKVKTIKNMKK